MPEAMMLPLTRPPCHDSFIAQHNFRGFQPSSSSMNWTGGRLHQHSKVDKSSTLYRQKQHFARVRQQFQEPDQAPTPFRPSFLGSDGMSPIQQSRLDDFRTTGPLAKRLASMSSRESASAPMTELRDADIARMLPPRKRRRGSRGVQTEQHTQQNDETDEKAPPATDDLESTRRRLLMQSDWLGLKVSSRGLFVSVRIDRSSQGAIGSLDTCIFL